MVEISFKMRVKEQNKADRQWKREHRISHYKYQMDMSQANRDFDGYEFWKAVLETNLDDN